MSACVLSCVWLFATTRTIGHQTPLSMGFPRQEYWSGLPFPSPGDLPNPGIETGSPLLLLLLSRFSRVRLCATPQTAAHQAPLSLPGILQARTLEWVAISFSRGSFQPRDWTWVSCIEAKFLTIWATKVMQPILLVCGNRFLPVHNSCSRAFLLDAFFFFFKSQKALCTRMCLPV